MSDDYIQNNNPTFDKPERTGELHTDLEHILNCYSREGVSNTPDFLLAHYLIDCLEVFEKTTQAREVWYGRH